jgi:NAD(P)-dependent dehydrogenase (short-subunit alcohol dehydrogenase family)
MVREFASAGHVVMGCGRDLAAIAKLREEWPAPHSFAVVDVADDDSVAGWAREVGEAGAPDLLVNNAAVINANANLWEVSANEFARVIDINIKGVANVIRHWLPGMLARGAGVIVNVSSGWGRSTSAEVAPYCATKWAIEGLTQALAQELPDGIAAVPMNPGVIDTDMLRSCLGESAGDYPNAAQWARTAVPFLLRLGPADNGRPVTSP